MPEYFESQLREGSARMADALDVPSAAEVRGRSDHRARRRRSGAVVLTVAAVLAVGGAAFGIAGQDGRGPAPSADRAAGPSDASADASHAASPTAGTASAAPAVPVALRLNPPSRYAAATANKVGLTITNPGAARKVVVEFLATGTDAQYWVEGCDSGVDGGCTPQAEQSNPLQQARGKGVSAPGVVEFDLALPAGTSSYTAYVTPPAGVNSYVVRVLEGRTVLGQAASGPLDYGFPSLVVASQASRSIARGGSSVEFDTTVDDTTSTSYVNMFSFVIVSCTAGNATVQVPQGAYTLDWYPGISWQAVGPLRELGQFGYALNSGQSTTTRFRLSLSESLPSSVTSCQVTQVISASDTSTAPFYDTSAPSAQATVTFEVR